MSEAAGTPSAEPQKKSKTWLIILVVVVVLCCLCLIAGVVAWRVVYPFIQQYYTALLMV
ncbi:MAG: hypothetical protein AB1449_07730 [Chloroflexota bacterium]